MSIPNSVKARNSIKFKLIVLPLIILFIAILSIGVASSLLLRDRLLEQTRTSGLKLSYQVASHIETAATSLEAIETMVEDDIRNAGKLVMTNQSNISNESIAEIAQNLEVDEINIFNPGGEITYSNLPENIGWVADKNHSIQKVLSGNSSELMEDIRKSSVSDDHYKYGYIMSPTGDVIQVGVLANAVYELSEKFSYQKFVEDLAQEEDVVYALFTDKSLKAIAHSNTDRIGTDLSEDVGSKTAAIDGEVYTSEYFYEADGVEVYDVLVPVYVN